MYIYQRDHDIKPQDIRHGLIFPEDIRAMQILARIDRDTQEQKRRTEEMERRAKQQSQHQTSTNSNNVQHETLEY